MYHLNSLITLSQFIDARPAGPMHTQPPTPATVMEVAAAAAVVAAAAPVAVVE
jgi:hypothetical protein